MRSTIQVLLTFIALLVAPATASAAFVHIVAPGESLSSVAAADGLTVDQLAAANGISTSAGLLTGSPLTIPPQTPGVVAAVAAGTPATAAGTPATAAGSEVSGEAVPDGDEGTAPTASSAAPSSAGGYAVRPGDTLSAIAAANGMTVDQLAADNGLSVSGILLAGSTLNLGGASSAASSGVPAPGGAQPTPVSVSAGEVGQVAADNGVSSSLAEAIGYQESGFNNSLVSGTGAIGVMQIEPGTWSYIERNLAGSSLSPSSVVDNVKGGVLLLHSLLDQTGGDPNLAVAGYYQGLRSVAEHGMFPDTQRYVADVMALAQRFGGP
jgi:soluble lytic murein transglycosylase-like protein